MLILKNNFFRIDGIYITVFFTCCQLLAQDLFLTLDIIEKIAFDFKDLKETSKCRWESQKDSVLSLFYQGNEFNGKSTEVFTYYTSPTTLSGKKSTKEKFFTAIVLVHSGGSNAFKIWVRKWAKKGYDAIAMDFEGSKPLPKNEQETPWSTKSNPLSNGAPDDTHTFNFFNIDKGFSTQWQFYAISNIIKAHTLVRSFPDIDTSQTAKTGISWVGYLTNIVAGIDHSIKAAVSVYGCGFFAEKSPWIKRFDSLGLSNSKKWKKLWDPSSYVSNVKIPMLFN